MNEIKPFKQIEKTKRVINNLKYKYQYSKNKVKDANDINTLIDTVEMFDNLLVSKYKTDAVDTLLYCLIYEWILQFQKEDTVKDYYVTDMEENRKLVKNDNYGKMLKIPFGLMIHNFKSDIELHSVYKKKQIISLLEHGDLCNMIADGSLKDWDGKYPIHEKLIDEIINELKSQMRWTK